mmetsp:Transcript_1684/g.2659  ORF Transcript_1684/g.2659 Transcript_1684/m.2659 type:complete len:235 (-) Transcript_1684:1523-2227(-)
MRYGGCSTRLQVGWYGLVGGIDGAENLCDQGCIFVYLSISGTLSARALTLTLAVCAACFYSVHLLRLQFPGLNAFLVKHYKNILRPDEARGKLPGAFYFLLGTALSCAVFDTHIFHLAILFLSFGDPAAGLFGTLLKRGNPGNSKSFGGSFAAFVASALSTLVLELICCHGSEINHDLTLAKVSLLGGIIGALAERVNLLGIDDNFTLPLCAGLAMTLLNQRVATFGICISLRS